MAIASFLASSDTTLQPGGVNRVSLAQATDVLFYDRAAYKRLQQVYPTGDTNNNNGPDQDYMLVTQYFPKASIEMLVMFEMGWWPLYVERTLGAFYYQQSQKTGQTVTAFTPAKLVKANQTLIRLEVFKAVEIFYSTLVTDNSNINEKDAKNYDFARKRFEEEWEKAIQESYFYDLKGAGEIGTYQQSWLADVNFFEGDRRYF
jgi:hypothetical protein